MHHHQRRRTGTCPRETASNDPHYQAHPNTARIPVDERGRAEDAASNLQANDKTEAAPVRHRLHLLEPRIAGRILGRRGEGEEHVVVGEGGYRQTRQRRARRGNRRNVVRFSCGVHVLLRGVGLRRRERRQVDVVVCHWSGWARRAGEVLAGDEYFRRDQSSAHVFGAATGQAMIDLR